MRKFTLLLFGFLISINLSVFSQNGLIGDGFGTNDWSTTDNFSESAGGTRIGTFSPNGTGTKYFRLVTNWDGNYTHYGPNSNTVDYQVTPSTAVPESEIVHNSTTKAYFIDGTDVSHKYVFKTKAGGNPPSSLGLIVFKIEGDVRSVSNVSQSPSSVNIEQDVTITATLDNTLVTGQGVYLRYTNENFANSSIIEMTGSGTSFSATIPSNVNSSGANIKYYIFTSGAGLTIAHGDADWYTINLNNGGSNYSYTVSDAFITKANGDWNDPNTWTGGVPPTGAKTIIAHNVTLNQDANVSSITINTGATFTASDATPRTLTIANNGTLTNNGTFTHANGTITFAGVGTVSGTVGFNNVILNGGVNFGSASTINGVLDLRAGSWVSTNAPTYAVGSTLKYNTGSEYGANAEWYANLNSGQGIPDNVVIGDVVANSGLSFGSSNTYRYASGDLTIANGATFSLSTAGGGDLKLGGDFTNNGAYNSNSRAIFFDGTNLQNITSSTNPFNIGLIINSNNTGLQINTPLSLELNNTGKVIIPSGVTLVGNTNGNAEVQQYSAEKRTYYMGSPVNPLSGLSGIENIATFDIANDTWSPLATASTSNIPTDGRGFLAQTPIGTMSFTGTLNNGNVETDLTLGDTKSFNFLGNPYPSYLRSSDIAAATGIDGTVWQRTKGTEGFLFVTYNTTGEGASLPTGYDGSLIAPMQGFWVNATTPGTFTFTNDMRTHNVGTTGSFKAPQVSQSQRFVLAVSNGKSTDEAMLRFNSDAGTGIDNWDSRKMMNSAGALNVFTLHNGVSLAINSNTTITEGVEIPVGLSLAAGTYTLSTKEFTNFAAGTKVNLLDKATGLVTDLSVTDYEFTLTESLNSSARFAIVFPKSDVPTSVEGLNDAKSTIFVRDNRIVVSTNEAANGGMIYVFNSVGQQIAAQSVNGKVNEINMALQPGVYVVKLKNQTEKVIVK